MNARRKLRTFERAIKDGEAIRAWDHVAAAMLGIAKMKVLRQSALSNEGRRQYKVLRQVPRLEAGGRWHRIVMGGEE